MRAKSLKIYKVLTVGHWLRPRSGCPCLDPLECRKRASFDISELGHVSHSSHLKSENLNKAVIRCSRFAQKGFLSNHRVSTLTHIYNFLRSVLLIAKKGENNLAVQIYRFLIVNRSKLGNANSSTRGPTGGVYYIGLERCVCLNYLRTTETPKFTYIPNISEQTHKRTNHIFKTR